MHSVFVVRFCSDNEWFTGIRRGGRS